MIARSKSHGSESISPVMISASAASGSTSVSATLLSALSKCTSSSRMGLGAMRAGNHGRLAAPSSQDYGICGVREGEPWWVAKSIVPSASSESREVGRYRHRGYRSVATAEQRRPTPWRLPSTALCSKGAHSCMDSGCRSAGGWPWGQRQFDGNLFAPQRILTS